MYLRYTVLHIEVYIHQINNDARPVIYSDFPHYLYKNNGPIICLLLYVHKVLYRFIYAYINGNVFFPGIAAGLSSQQTLQLGFCKRIENEQKRGENWAQKEKKSPLPMSTNTTCTILPN